MKRAYLYAFFIALCAASIFSDAAVDFFWRTSRIIDEPLHSTVEAMGAVTAVIMAMILLQQRGEEYGGKFFMVAMGFLGMGILDAFHAVSKFGEGFVLLHSLATFVGGFWFALIWRERFASDEGMNWRRAAPWIVTAASIVIGFMGLFAEESLHAMIHEGEFTTTAIALNFMGGVLFIAAAVWFLMDFHHSGKLSAYLFACLAVLFGMAGINFQYSVPWDVEWWFWHTQRLLAYIIVLGWLVYEHQYVINELVRKEKPAVLGQIAGSEGHELRNRAVSDAMVGAAPKAIQLTLVLIALALIVPLIGFAITRLYGPQIEREAYADLEAIAQLKAEQIENWLSERRGDSEMLAADDAFAARVSRFVQHRQRDATLSKPVLERFEQLLSNYHYTRILLLDTGGRLVLTSGEEIGMAPVLPGLWRQALGSKQVQRRDIYRDEEGHIHLEWAVPIAVPDAQGGRAVAVVVLRVTAQQFIFPLIQSWPTASASGETLLVRREGESVMYLNELRHRQDTALRLVQPSTDAELIASAAVRSAKPGRVQGSDYRNVPVLAAYRLVAGTNWSIVAKIDRAEVLAPLRDLVLWISLIALAAIAAVSAAVMLLWRQQHRAYQVEMRERSMAAIEESERRYRAITQSANDAIVIIDSVGNVIGWNDSAGQMFGYAEAEIAGQPLAGLMPEQFRDRYREGWARAASGGERRIMDKTVELAGLRKDGGEFPLELSLAQWQTSAGRFFSATIRDISRRKLAEAKIQRLTQLYAALSQCNEAIVRCTSEEELFPQICRDAVQFGGMKMAWIGLVGEEGRKVKAVASYGKGTEYLEGIRISANADDPSGRGPTGTAIRENQPQWCEDFQHDPLTAPWHERAAHFGWGSSAALPLLRNGVVVGAFTLYSGAVNDFDEAGRRLLAEMARDISFALDSFDREARRKQAELELAASERHFHSLFENMLEGYVHCKMLYREGVPEDFVYLEVNRAFETLSGLKDAVGRRATEVIPGMRESNPELFETYGRVAQRGQPEQLEMYVDALAKWFAITVYCPEPEHFVAIFENVTARKQSEQVLAESEQRFRGLVEQSLAGIYIIQDGRFVYVNPRFAEIFGYGSASELIGVEPVSLVAEQDRELVAENIRSRLGGELQSLSYGFTAVRKDGSLIDVGVHGARATHLGRPAILGLMQDVSEKKRAEEQIQHYIKQLEESFLHTIEVATTLVEMRDPYTAGHEKRVALIAVAIGTEMGLDAHRIEGLRVGGYIHDIGKIIVPAEILSKPGRLSAVEYELIKGHPQAGYDILKNVDFPWPVADIAHQHHERMDGSGYPRGLKGEEILLEARITAVADVVEAMSSHRPYRPGIGLEQALTEIERGSGDHFDPVVVAACLRLFREKGYELPV